MSRSRERRVVVTGLGCVSPVGNSVADAWTALIEGKSGIATITKFDATPFSTRFAGEVKGFNIEDYIPGKEARHMDTFIHYGMAAGMRSHLQGGSKARVRLASDGCAVVETDLPDIGTGHYTILAQVAADALEIPMEKVRVELGRSDLPSGAGSAASWGAANTRWGK